MPRNMLDSVSPAAVAASGRTYSVVAGYANGLFGPENPSGWTQAAWDRFPAKTHVHIDVNGTDPAGAGVLDVETGDASVADAPVWARERRRLGHSATIYCNLSTWPAVIAAMGDIPTYYWIASWTGSPHRPEADGRRADVCQYANLPAEDLDLSIIFTRAWHHIR